MNGPMNGTNDTAPTAPSAIVPPQAAKGLPPGYRTPRVRRAMQLLADGLDEAYMLAFEIPSPEFPAEFTDQEKRRIRELLKSAKT